MEEKSEIVELGKILHELFKKKEKTKEMKYFRIKVDYLTKELVVEFKKSKKLEKAAEWQLKYYLWVLGLKKGVLILGREKKEISLDEKDIDFLEKILKEIRRIINLKKPPPIEKKPYCESCAYYFLCFS